MTVETYTQSELGDAGQCLQKWWFGYRAGEKQCGIRSTKPYIPYIEGRFTHKTLEEYRRTGRMHKANLMKWFEKTLSGYTLEDNEGPKIRKRIMAAYGACLGYKAVYPDDPKLEWIGLEEKFDFQFHQFRFAGKIDGIRRGEKGIIVRETKFAAKSGALAMLALPLNLQRWVYTMGAKSVTREYPVAFEPDFIWKTQIRQKQKETAEQFEQRVLQTYTENPKEMFHRELMPIESSMVEGVFAECVLKRVHLLQARRPYMNDKACVPFAGRPCEFLPACKAILQGKNGWQAPECAGLYVEKETRHPELEEE